MWRTWASPDEPRATLQRTTGVRCIAPCFKTHTHIHTHMCKHTSTHLIHSSPYPKNIPDVLWWVIEWKGLHRKVWRLSDLILDACCLRLLFYLPSSFTRWLSLVFFSRSLTIIRVIFAFFAFGIHCSCSHIFLWLSSLPQFMTCWQVHGMALSTPHVFYGKNWGNVTPEDIF